MTDAPTGTCRLSELKASVFGHHGVRIFQLASRSHMAWH